MKIYNNSEEVKKDIINNALIVDDDVTFNFDFDFNNCDINAGDISAGNINAWNINAEDIKACNINTGNINAGDIKACNINTGDISAGDISAWNINAEDINAEDINAVNISYYASCISYNNIKCKSIVGHRENSFHKCLDGELIIIPDKHIITIDNKKIELSEESYNNLKEQLK